MEIAIFQYCYPHVWTLLESLDQLVDILLQANGDLKNQQESSLIIVNKSLTTVREIMDVVTLKASMESYPKLEEMIRDLVKLRLTILSPLFLMDNTCQTPLYYCQRVASALSHVQAQ